MGAIVGIDIGATNLRVALSDENGKMSKIVKARTDPQTIIDDICKAIDGFGPIDGIGIASIGPLDMKRGMITNAANVGIRNLSLVEPLKERYNVPTILLNECVAAALGERIFGAGQNVKNLVYITLSTGIGAGVIADNRLLLGKDGNAHEIGHFIVDPESPLKCGCGSYGHWEAYCAGRNIANFARLLLSTDFKAQKSQLRDQMEGLSGELLFGMDGTDEVAKLIVEKILKINALQIANVINMYDPELVTIGGAIALRNEERVMGAIKGISHKYTINRMPEIMTTPLKDDICLYGAVASVLHSDWVKL